MSNRKIDSNGAHANGMKVNGMPQWLRRSVYLVGGGLWLSGCVWLVLHLFFQTPTPFGAEPHAWEPPLLLIHGVLGVPALYLLGWISSRHALDGWRMARRRLSGGIISSVLVVLAYVYLASAFIGLAVTRIRQRGDRSPHDSPHAVAIDPPARDGTGM